MTSLVDGLNNLPIFEGVPDADRSRAIITAGLSMLQPRNPVTQGGGLQAVGGGIADGLASLDGSAARRASASQQAFDNTIATQDANSRTTSAEASATTANAATTNAETNAAGVAEEARQFNAEAALRDADVDLKKAEAAWLARRHDGSPAGSGSVTQAQLDKAEVEARMEVLVGQDPTRYTLPDGSTNAALAMTDAFQSIYVEKGLLSNEGLAVITDTPGAGEETRQNVEGLLTNFQPPVGDAAVPVVTDQASYDAIPVGGQYTLNGQTYVKSQ
jgi:hypothetical protein